MAKKNYSALISIEKLNECCFFKTISVYYASDQRCVINQTVPVVSSIGYLANIITDETNRGSSLCPWKIQLQQGQTVHLTLLNFGVYQNVTTSDKGTICHIYAVLKDSFVSNDGPGSLVCGGDVRETLVLTSMAKEVQISMKKLNSPPRDPIYFLIKYEGMLFLSVYCI